MCRAPGLSILGVPRMLVNRSALVHVQQSHRLCHRIYRYQYDQCMECSKLDMGVLSKRDNMGNDYWLGLAASPF